MGLGKPFSCQRSWNLWAGAQRCRLGVADSTGGWFPMLSCFLCRSMSSSKMDIFELPDPKRLPNHEHPSELPSWDRTPGALTASVPPCCWTELLATLLAWEAIFFYSFNHSFYGFNHKGILSCLLNLKVCCFQHIKIQLSPPHLELPNVLRPLLVPSQNFVSVQPGDNGTR